MAYRFTIDGRYRSTKSRFLLAQRIKDEFTAPKGKYRWITEARPNTLLHVFISGDTFSIRALKIPYGSILSPNGAALPIMDYYRQTIAGELTERIRRSAREFRKERACFFFVIHESEGQKPHFRELEFVEFRESPMEEDVCLDFTTGLENVPEIEFETYLK